MLASNIGNHSSRNTSVFRTRSGAARQIPLLAPEPPRLSRYVPELEAIEASGVFSNYGPVNTAFERDLIDQVFGEGACVTVCNATIGLMLAIREVIDEDRAPACQYALMPSFTFAATAQAALWCGLRPLLCDIDPETWLPDAACEQRLLEQYAGQIAVIVPYATFGNNLDLDRYGKISEEHGIPIVVDAAASLGSIDENGKAFGAGFMWPIVFSMHATKAFSVGEGGILYCGDEDRIGRLRSMGSFGFSQPRSAQTIGLNSKLSEVAALSARLQLRDMEEPLAHRESMARIYDQELGLEFQLQKQVGQRQALSFQSVVLPPHLGAHRAEVVEGLQTLGIGAGTYFSPHLAEQPYIQKHATCGPLPVTNDVCSRILSLPLTASITSEQVRFVSAALRSVTDRISAAAERALLMPRMPATMEVPRVRKQVQAA